MVKYSTLVTDPDKLSGTVVEYQGKRLPEPITFTFDADQFISPQEIKDAGEWPNDAVIMQGINRDKVTSAKAQAYQKATAELKKQYEGSVEFKRNAFIKSALAGGVNQAQAEAMADSIPGLKIA